MMTTQIMSGDKNLNSVRKVVSVQASPAIAWRVFAEQMGTWWPLGQYKIGKANAVDAVIEPRVGGRWYERGDDGSSCDWGRVLAWEPPSRLVLSWDITADWQYDPALQTEIEVRFIAEGETRTRVEFEHRRLDGMATVATKCAQSSMRPGIGVNSSRRLRRQSRLTRRQRDDRHKTGAASIGRTDCASRKSRNA